MSGAPAPPTEAQIEQIAMLVIELAKQSCRDVLKYQTFEDDDSPHYLFGWEVCAAACEAAIEENVLRLIKNYSARTTLTAAPTPPPKASADIVEVPNGPGILMTREKAELHGLAYRELTERAGNVPGQTHDQ